MTTKNPTIKQAGGPDGNYDTVSSFLVAVGILALVFGGWWAVVTTFAPQTLALDVAGKHIVLENFPKKLLGGLPIGMIAIAGVFIAEFFLAGWSQSSLRHMAKGSKSAWSDIVMFVLNEIHVTKWILIIFTLGIGLASGEALHKYVAEQTGAEFGIGSLPVYIQLPIVYLIYTYLDYWTHRVGHQKTFWPIHRFHHAAKEFHILTAIRVHPADLSSVFILSVPLMFLAPSAETLFLLYAWLAFVRNVIHSRIPSNFGIVGRWLVQSPLDHRMHHILDMSQGEGLNYSLMPLWDRLHNTWRPGGYPALEIGVDDKPYRHGAWVVPDLVRDYIDFLKNVGAKFGVVQEATVVVPGATSANSAAKAS